MPSRHWNSRSPIAAAVLASSLAGPFVATDGRAAERVVVFSIQDPHEAFDPDGLDALSVELVDAIIEEGDVFDVVLSWEDDEGLEPTPHARTATPTPPRCASRACELREAKSLGVHRFVTSRMIRFLDRCALSLTLVDVESGRTQRGATAVADCSGVGIFSSLLSAVGSLSRQMRILAGVTDGAEPPVSDAPPSDAADVAP